MRQSVVALSMHIGDAGGDARTIRLLEATGLGACMRTGRSVDLAEYFAIETEVVGFENKDGCIEKARWLLEIPREREEIARSDQVRTMRDRTCVARADQSHEVITELQHRG